MVSKLVYIDIPLNTFAPPDGSTGFQNWCWISGPSQAEVDMLAATIAAMQPGDVINVPDRTDVQWI